MTRKIFRSILLVAGLVLLASFAVSLGVLYRHFASVQEDRLAEELDLAAVSVEQSGTEYLERLRSDRYRITWIAPDGGVRFDTKTDAESMQNHLGRKEVAEALTTGTGRDARYSDTLLEKTLYAAKRLSDGSVLRIAVSQSTVWALVFGTLQPLLLVLVVALILSGLLAGRLSKRIVNPLNSLDLEHPFENDTYEELSPLLGKIDRQHREIDRRLQELQRRTDEFTQITDHLDEGLVLLDGKGDVLSINPAACRIFRADDAVGHSFLNVDRSHAMSTAVGQALAGGHGQFRYERDGREYRIDASPIQSDGTGIGCVLLAFDITEQAYAEQLRREFTANVSHELKTPLQGIIGSADLIESGLMKPEDLPRFVGHIRQEAARLLTLIGDILRLSQLDEGTELPQEDVDLMALAAEVTKTLGDAAASRQITLSLDGRGGTLHGVARLLYEVLYNLCDNAIQYNRPGGQVHITVDSDETECTVTVSDTGIGIAPEYQSRVFERFFRVDKSHSKASGGTGLGLSIVKHAVQYHHGTIELHSTLGQGTVIRLHFPRPTAAE